jgi:hypothetical protein
MYVYGDNDTGYLNLFVKYIHINDISSRQNVNQKPRDIKIDSMAIKETLV